MRPHPLGSERAGRQVKAHPTNALFTDLYQLTMGQAYYRSGQSADATFSLFFRRFPTNRAYYVFCGLETALDYLDNFAFTSDDIAALKQCGLFDDDFLDHLRNLRLTCSVRAMDEGQVFFPNEPVMEVSGPIIHCQLVETALINLVNLESMLATKAARVVDAAQVRTVADFSARRTHGMDAAFGMARASYIAGFSGTSNVDAAQSGSESPCWEPWPIPTCRRSTTKPRHSDSTPGRFQTAAPSWSIPTTRWPACGTPSRSRWRWKPPGTASEPFDWTAETSTTSRGARGLCWTMQVSITYRSSPVEGWTSTPSTAC